MKNNKAFTLVEVIVTISIMILIASVGIPSIINISNKKQSQQCNKLKTLVEEKAIIYARTKSGFNLPTIGNNVSIQLSDLETSNLFDNVTNNDMFDRNFSSNTNITISIDSQGKLSANMEGACQ